MENPQPIFGCKLCKKEFKQGGQLKSHMRVHSDLGQYKCEFCQRKSNDLASLKKHITSIHQDNTKDYICTTCEKVYKKYSSLYRHEKICNSDERKFYCVEC